MKLFISQWKCAPFHGVHRRPRRISVYMLILALGINCFLINPPAALPKKLLPNAGLSVSRINPVEPMFNSAPVKGFNVIFLHHPYTHDRPTVKLLVPERYARVSKSGVINSIGFAFFTDYPDLKGVFDFPSSVVLSCTGFCNGRMLIDIQNRYGDNFSLTKFENTERNNHLYKNVYYINNYGFSRAEQVEWKNYNPTMRQNRYYLFDKVKSTELSRYVQCLTSIPNPMCEEWFTMKYYPGLLIHYTFSYKLIENSFAVRQSVEHLINNFVAGTV